MDLYIRQKVFSLRNKFSVMDFAGNDRYYVEGDFLSLRNKLQFTTPPDVRLHTFNES